MPVQMILAWVAFPLVLIALGAGWGVLVEKAIGREVQGALLVPLGLMAALVVAAFMTASAGTAPAAVAVVAVGGVAGLVVSLAGQLLSPLLAATSLGKRLSPWPAVAALGVLLVYGAPVLLSGEATFAGYVTLDDNTVWFAIVDQLFAHGRAVDVSMPSTYASIVDLYLRQSGYPVGGFLLVGVGRGLVGVDVAWVMQPYLALCGALVGLPAYALLERFVASRPLRAGLAFVAAQPALLVGYSQWGGIKELTAAWVLIAGIAVVEPCLLRAAPKPREVLVLALPAAALVTILGAAAIVWLAVPLVAVAASWGWEAWWERGTRPTLVSGATLVAATALLALPTLLTVSKFAATDGALYADASGAARDTVALGALHAPLSPFQLAGIWPVGDLRDVAPTLPTAILVAIVLGAALVALAVGVRRRQPAVAVYVATAVLGVLAVYLAGGSPWVVAKALAIGTPALLVAGLLGGALALQRSRAAGIVVCGLLTAGVLWSNALAYHDVRLAPRPRLAELQDVGRMIDGKGPTLFNEHEVYGTNHFLRKGATAGTDETGLTLRTGQRLAVPSVADLDAVPLDSVLRYRTIVTRASATQSRPPALYRRVWHGSYYEVWQRPETQAGVAEVPVLHAPGGDSAARPYCGSGDKGTLPLCSVAPASVAPCQAVRQLRTVARRVNGRLVAFERASPIVARANQSSVPKGWKVNVREGTVVPTHAGTMTVRFRLGTAQRYGVWLSGTFARGFRVSVDGRAVGRVSGQRLSYGTYARAGAVTLAAGAHAVALTYLPRGLRPDRGPGESDTVLFAVALEQLGKPTRMLAVAPADAGSLCGRSLDWIEVVRPVVPPS